MFFMGEEIGAQKPYRFDTFINNRENLAGERAADGAKLFRFYQDVIRFSRRHAAARSQEIDIIHALGSNRVIAFTRPAGSDKLLLVASLRNQPFPRWLCYSNRPIAPAGRLMARGIQQRWLDLRRQ
jgi:1,4-alpha-glucan branching enzyme